MFLLSSNKRGNKMDENKPKKLEEEDNLEEAIDQFELD